MTPDFDRLLSDLCDGTISDADLRHLGGLVAADPAARARYVQYLDLHAALGGLAVPGEPIIEPARPRATRRNRRAVWSAAGALAASLLIAVVLVMSKPSAKPEVAAAPELTFAELGQDTELSDESGQPAGAREGAPLKAGQTIRTGPRQGFAALDFGPGAHLELGPDACLRLAPAAGTTGTKLILSAGLLRGRVADADLTVVTPHAEVHVREASFLVSAAGDATEVEADGGSVRAVRFADGRSTTVPSGSSLLVSALLPMEARPMLAAGGEQVLKLKNQPAVSVAFTPDGKRLVLRSKGARWETFRAGTGEPLIGSGPPAKDETGVALSADGGTMFFLNKDAGRVRAVDTATGRERAGWNAEPGLHAQWSASGDGSRLAACCLVPMGKPRVVVWDSAGKELHARELDRWPRAFALSPDGRTLAWAADTPGQRMPRQKFHLTPVAADAPPMVVAVPDRPVAIIAFDQQSKTLATGTDQGVVRTWDRATGRLLREYPAPGGSARPASALAFSPDGAKLAAGRVDGRADVWDAADPARHLAISASTRPVNGLAFAADGALAVCPNRDSVTVWAVR